MKNFQKVSLCTIDKPIKECVKRSEVMAANRDFGFVYCPVNKGYMFVHAIVQTNPTQTGQMHIKGVGIVKTRTVKTDADIRISDKWDTYHHMDVYFPKQYWSASTDVLHSLVDATCSTKPCSCQHDCCGCVSIALWHKATRVSRKCVRVSINVSRNY